MKVKTYRGNEMESLMTQIKDEMGDEAIILSMKELGDVIEVNVGTDQVDTPSAGNLFDLSSAAEQIEKIETKRSSKKTIFNSNIRQTQTILIDILERQGIEPSLSQDIIRNSGIDGRVSLSADKYISNGLSNVLEFNSLIPQKSRVVAFIGATGVGKTTSIAKLAARIRMTFDLKIALISADSFRVGAGYHLQTYASLMNLPFRMIAATGEPTSIQLRRAVDSFKSFDLILIDTAGCGPRDSSRIADLVADISEVPEAEKILALPAPSNASDLHFSAQAFEKVGFDRVVLTKLDESGFIGPVINTVAKLGKPVGFLTTGQRVPEDIEPASARRLGWMLTRTMH